MSKRDKELAEIFEAVRYACDNTVLTEADVMGMIKRGAQFVKDKLGMGPKQATINWESVYKFDPDSVTKFVQAPTAKDKALIFEKLKEHPEIRSWAIENLGQRKGPDGKPIPGPAEVINKFKNLPPNDPRRRAAAKVIEQAQKEILQTILPLVRDAEEVVKRHGMTMASKAKMGEDKEIQDIAKVITEDIRTNNGIILESDPWDINNWPMHKLHKEKERDERAIHQFFEFLEQKGINPPENLNSLVLEFLGIDREKFYAEKEQIVQAMQDLRHQ
jgi:hypothetical protein